MYFVYPTRVLPFIETALSLFSDIKWIKLNTVSDCDHSKIFIFDVYDYLKLNTTLPAIVISDENEAELLSQAWKKGALAGWTWQNLPSDPISELQRIKNQYKRNQDSRDLPIAADLQKHFLPNQIDFAHYQLKTLFKPAAYLSGDWFDFWWVDETHFLFYLADVSGHGVTSSLLTMWLAAFHGQAASPIELLQKINRQLLVKNCDKHITMVSVMIDIQTHKVITCNAGHFPPLTVLAPDKEVKIFQANSLALGLSENIKFSEAEFTLEPTERIIICSDGALEPYDGGLNQQFKQLIETLKMNQFHAPDDTKDDIAILSLRRLE